MNPSVLILFIIIGLAIALLSVYVVLRSTHRYMKKTIKRVRRQRNHDLRWHRDALLAQMRLEEARKH